MKVILLTIFYFASYSLCSTCGDGICSNDETKWSCFNDCNENNCTSVYSITESGCFSEGWTRLNVTVDGIIRELFYKFPDDDEWVNGTIIFHHGGGGVDSNICYPVPLVYYLLLPEEQRDALRGLPVSEFGKMAIEQGFAVFSLNSALNRGTDGMGNSIGKRFECLEIEGQENGDLKFFEKVVQDTIPSMRPSGSSDKVFVTGISNGGYFSTLAAAHFNDKIDAFAPVSAGDPFGTYWDLSIQSTRRCAPGALRNLESPYYFISQDKGCFSDGDYPNELEWPSRNKDLVFKQFYHEEDTIVNNTCMAKIRNVLTEKGYHDDGAFFIPYVGDAQLAYHYWQFEYSQPLLDFFFRTRLNLESGSFMIGISTICIILAFLS